MLVVDCADVVDPSASGYQLVPFVSNPKWVPYKTILLNIS